MRISTFRPDFWLCAALAPILASCSVIGMKRVSSDPDPSEVVDCTASWTMPIVDMASAVITGSAGVVLHSQASSEDDEEGGDGKGFRIAAWSSLAASVVFIASGAYGAVQRARCQNAQEGTGPVEKPAWKDEITPPARTLGARCQSDDDCGEALVCDEPMKTCIEPPTPPAPAAPPGQPPDTTPATESQDPAEMPEPPDAEEVP